MRLLLILLLSLLSLVSASQQQHISTTPSHPRKTLQFWNEIIDTIKTPSTWIHPSVKYHKFQHLDAAPKHIMDATPAGDNGEKHSYVVQFNTPYTLAIKQQVATYLNTTFGSYIPNDAYMVYIYASQAQALIQDPTINIYISSVQPFKPNNKIHSCVYKPTSDQNTTHLDILLVGEFSAADQLAMGTTWSQGMATGVNATTTAWNITNTNIMEIQVESEAHILHVANFLSTMDETALIQRRTTFRTKNKWGRGEGMNAIGDPNYVAQTGVITFLHPELSGQGEIIGSADTGLDWKSCYFYDQNFPNGPPGEKAWVSALQQPNIVRAVPSDQQHRKVVQYVAFADNIDADGHGTHVQGTLSGVGWNFPTGSILNQFNGMAPAAKLAFFDIGSSATGALSVPTNMDQDLFTWAYAAGARIHSNSWGGMSGGYDLNAQMVDSFIFNHPDMLILFAAGNDGIRGQGSISSPSTAKNGLAIGSAMNSNQAWIQSFCATGFLPTPLLCQVATADPVLFGETSMSAFSSQGPTPDTITSGRLKPEIVLPGEWLLSALNGQDPATSCSNPAAQVLKKDAGTSMATPMAASLAALVRQWLRTGYYPTGTPTIDNSFTPSAALLKAVMIASTRPLTGKFDANDVLFPGGRATVPTVTAPTTLEPTPNYRQGYGRMELQNGIYFPTDPHRMLILQDKANPYWEPSLANNGETKTLTFCVTGTLPSGNTPKVTLVWTDPPVIATVATVVVNNLDLTVQPVGGTVVYQGNQGLPGITLPDAINNVEMVTLPNPTGPTAYTATVTATALGQGPQSFSLVVTGQVKMGVCSPAPVETFQWVSTAWGQCSQACVQTTIGIQKRSVFCVSNLNGGVPDSQCTNNPNLGAKPAETQACNTIPCYSMKYYWVPGAYGPCTQTCGGNKTRANACVGTTGFVTTNDFCSGLTPPTVTTTCAQDPCNNPPSAIFSKWVVSTCTCSAPCNGGTCTRTVACQVNGTVVNDNICLAAGNGPKPIPLQACNTQSCTPVVAGAGSTPTYSWLIGDWSSCSVSCGGGLQTRSVRCRNAAGYLDSDSLCSAIPKPATNATCATDACTIAPVEPATYNWVTGLWGPCNVQTLMMSRWVICSTTSGQLMDVATCESSVGTMPITTQTCTPDANSQSVNSQPPVYQWTAGLFSDPSIWCGPGAGVTTRLPLCIGSSGSVAAMGTQCPSPMPATQQITTGVNATCAKTPQWYVGQYLSDCTNTINPCQGVQQRHVVCVGTNGQVLGDTTQCTGVMPAATRQCAACVKNSSQRITSTWTMLSVIMSMMMICWTTWR